MARYIDADKLEMAVLKPSMFDINKDDVIALISEQPTADVEDVVRCKNCEHWIYWADEKRGSCKLHHMSTNRDDFCSCGKRRAK